MRVRLYNNYISNFIISGIIFMNVLALGLCAFFAYRFLIADYDSGGYVLILMLLGILVCVDILLCRQQIITRFLVWCKIDHTGLHCSLLWKKWTILWKDVHTFGIFGYKKVGFGLMFFATWSHPIKNDDELVGINKEQVLFEIRPQTWNALKKYMPVDLYERLYRQVNGKRDCFFKR